MNFIQAFKMSLKAIMSSKARAFLTMLGIIIGISAVMVMASLVEGAQKIQIADMEKMGKNKLSLDCWSYGMKDPSDKIYKFCMEELSDYTLGVTPNGYFWTQMRYKGKIYEGGQYLFGNSQFAVCNGWEIESGRDLSIIDIEHRNRVVVIGAAVKEAWFKYINPVGQWVTMNGERFQIIGVYKAKWDAQKYSMDDLVVAPYTMQNLLDPQGRLNSFVVKCKDFESTKMAKAKLETFLKPIFGGNAYIYTQDEYIVQTEEAMERNRLVVLGIASISLLVGGIGIMNIMLVTVTERTREIGIRKAIGAPRRSIIAQFLIESSVVSLFGGIFGLLFGTLATLVAGQLQLHVVLMPSAFITTLSVVISVAIGVLFGLFPAVKASKLQPVDALRAE